MVALVLLLVKKSPVKEETKVETKEEKPIENVTVKTEGINEVPQAEPIINKVPVEEPIINEVPVEEPKIEEPTVESTVDAVPTEETETLDIEEVQEPTNEPQVGEVNIQTEELNTDSTSTSDDDIWKF